MAESKNKSFCSVPKCLNSKQKQPYLRFHSFPTDEEQRRRWVCAIKRDIGPTFAIRRGSTYVCSRHFVATDYFDSDSGRLKVGTVPSLFEWNSYGVKRRETAFERANARLGVDVRELEVNTEEAMEEASNDDHDYGSRPPPFALDDALEYIKELEARLQNVSLSPIVDRYCASDEQFRFYTRFPSEVVFRIFWDSICPSASRLAYWTKAQRIAEDAFPTPSPPRKLALIDELFLYCCRVALGLKEMLLANMFKVSMSTVSRITISWANYLYLVLASVPIWIPREKVQSSMPEKFKEYCPNVRVILDCTEIPCESSTSLTLQSETFSFYKNTTTFKGLIGIAPCGLVTFISSLYTGSISDKDITRRSGILALLEPGDDVMADKGFVIEEMLAGVGANLIIPPFKHSAQFTKEETEKTQAIARLRILVERVIRRVKEYHIWDCPVPLSLSGSVNQMWYNCCFMVNYQGPMFLE